MVGPTFGQMKDIAWDALKQMTFPIPKVAHSETELRVDFPNNSRIRLYGAENPDRMRGLALDGVVMDEPAQHPSSLFPKILRPALSDRKGWGVWIGTPNGKDHFHRIFTEAKDMGGEWYTSMLRASESGVLDQEELDAALRDMIAQSGEAAGKSQYRQEYECDFDAPVIGAAFGEALDLARRGGRVGRVGWEPGIPVDVAFDLGIGDATTLLFGQRVGREKRIIDCYSASGEGYGHYVNYLREKPYTYRMFFLPHDGGHKQLGDSAGRTLAEIFEGYGIRPVRVLERSDIEPGVNAARVLLSSCWIDEEKCAPALEAWASYHRKWDEKARTWRGYSHDWSSHFADCARYLAQAWEVYGATAKTLEPEDEDIYGGKSKILNAYGQPFQQAANSWML